MLRLSDFDYDLPQELIAQYPQEKRDSARLLVLERKSRGIQHRTFRDITGYIGKDDLLVLNDTKVLPSRIFGKRLSGGKVELLLLERRKDLGFRVLIRPARLRLGEKIVFNGGKISATVKARDEVEFAADDPKSIYSLGVMPLPPYIKREAQERDFIYYQTIYAREEGAIASPTAGLHFSEELLKKIKNTAFITLHVGYGTFKPVKAEEITAHKMEAEYFKIPPTTIKKIERTRQKNGRIIAVGTTTCRTLETYAAGKKDGFTDLFIYPGYKFKMADSLLTNFHLPRTTLFMLVCAFAGEKLIKKAYQEAIEQKYRFYSYGDAMLIV